MGKRSRQIKKKQGTQQNAQLKSNLQELFAKRQYSEVINELAELISKKCYDADAMYAGAYSYYMLGDNERAVVWAENTLKFAPTHLPVRILLARLCFHTDKLDSGFALLEYVLQHGKENLSDDETEMIRQLVLENSFGNEAEIARDYPVLSQYLPSKFVPKQQELAESEQDSLAEICASHASVKEKIGLLNRFAGGFYVSNELLQAERYLEKALAYDEQDEMTIRNMVVLQKALGNLEKAQAIAAKLPITDFVLLSHLKMG
ncbi:CDC27 family protein [Selenomonas sp. FC4001]|uniref:tetratricopeptide repeat protein n=1 Tax=Selenomonas sp. FC4001 TaxID=1408313 RepID=UPI00055AC6A7|nr:CDC27 family protein [Selenomonas sp. FC4001]